MNIIPTITSNPPTFQPISLTAKVASGALATAASVAAVVTTASFFIPVPVVHTLALVVKVSILAYSAITLLALSLLRKNKKNSNLSFKEFQAAFDNLKKKVVLVENLKTQVEQSLQKAKNEMNALTTERDNLKINLDKAAEELKKANDSYAKEHSKNLSDQKLLNELKSNLDSAEHVHKDLKVQLSDKEQQLVQKSNDLSVLETEKNATEQALKLEIQKIKDDLSQLEKSTKDEKTCLNSNIEDLKAQLSRAEEDKKSSAQSYEERVSQLQNTLNEMRDGLENERKSNLKSLEEKAQEIAKLATDKVDLQQQIAASKKELVSQGTSTNVPEYISRETGTDSAILINKETGTCTPSVVSTGTDPLAISSTSQGTSTIPPLLLSVGTETTALALITTGTETERKEHVSIATVTEQKEVSSIGVGHSIQMIDRSTNTSSIAEKVSQKLYELALKGDKAAANSFLKDCIQAAGYTGGDKLIELLSEVRVVELPGLIKVVVPSVEDAISPIKQPPSIKLEKGFPDFDSLEDEARWHYVRIGKDDKSTKKLITLLYDHPELRKNYRDFIKISAEAGILSMQMVYADLLRKDKQLEEAQKCIDKAIEKIHSNEIRKNKASSYSAQALYIKGAILDGLRKYDEAYQLFKQASKLSHVKSEYLVAKYQLHSKGRLKDQQQEGFDQLTLLCIDKYKCFLPALKLLAECYEQGNGTAKNLTLAFECYDIARERGDLQSKKIVANMLISGTGVTKNPPLGNKYLAEFDRAEGRTESDLNISLLNTTQENSRLSDDESRASSAPTAFSRCEELLKGLEKVVTEVENIASNQVIKTPVPTKERADRRKSTLPPRTTGRASIAPTPTARRSSLAPTSSTGSKARQSIVFGSTSNK